VPGGIETPFEKVKGLTAIRREESTIRITLLMEWEEWDNCLRRADGLIP